MLIESRLRKGDALAVARIAGIQAAKKTSDLIPLAHPGLSITGVTVDLHPFPGDNVPYPISEYVGDGGGYDLLGSNPVSGGVLVTATVSCDGKTGVEMEALTAASVAGLTMYDMLKGIDKAMVLTSGRVTAKSGGKSGDWKWDYKSRTNVLTRQPTRWAGGDAIPAPAEERQSPEPDSDAQLIADLQAQDKSIKEQRIVETVHKKSLMADTIAPVPAEVFLARRLRLAREALDASQGARHSVD